MNNIQLTKLKKIVPIVFAALALIILSFASTVIIEPGHTGVVITLGKVEETVMEEGMHFRIPFVQQIKQIDNRIVKLEVETEAFSKDLQTVKTRLAINYRIAPTESYSIYKNVGSDYEDVLIVPAVNEVLKAMASKYTAEESVSNRDLISDGLVSGLNDKLNTTGLYITDVNIIDFDFSEEFINAIEEKQVAQQQLLKAETEKQTAITNAEAEAESLKIKAEAEAEANRVLNESLTKNIIDYYKVDKWNGVLPQVSGSDAIIDLSE